MNDREKLIELLKVNTCPGLTFEDCEFCKYDGMKDCLRQGQADHLIANGVVVREKGEWKPVKYNAHCSCGKSYGTYHYECQVCHRVSYAQPYGLNFCPNCGADMRGAVNDGNL